MQKGLLTAEQGAIPVAIAARLRRARALARLATVLPFVALGAISVSGCGGSSGPSGTYTATITDAPEGEGFLVNGPWAVRFEKGGSYTVIKGSPKSSNFKLTTGPGSYYRGTTFVINPVPASACGPPPGTGTYHLQLSGEKLTFVMVTDPCKTRSRILARTFTKERPKKVHPFTSKELQEFKELRERRLKELKEHREHPSSTTK